MRINGHCVPFSSVQTLQRLAAVQALGSARLRMARPWWRKVYYLVFPVLVLMFIHGVFTDPALSNGKVDLLDGGEVFIEVCFMISLATWAVRIRLRGQGFRLQR